MPSLRFHKRKVPSYIGPGVVEIRYERYVLLIASRAAGEVENVNRGKLQQNNHNNGGLQDIYDTLSHKFPDRPTGDFFTYTLYPCETLEEASALRSTLMAKYRADGDTMLNTR